MLISKRNNLNENKELEYIDTIYDSSNILQSTYFPEKERLYVAFNRGGVYSYGNISKELYEEFENAKSQGKFFASKIKKYPEKYSYRKEYTLYPFEIKKFNEEKEQKNEIQIFGSDHITNDIIFNINYKTMLKITKDGFFINGEFVEDKEKIYNTIAEYFKSWKRNN